MATTSLKEQIEKSKSAPAVVETQLVVEEAPSPAASAALDARDIKIPRLSLVAKTGTLADKFIPGNFVLNKEIVVSDGKTPLELVVVNARKYFVEDVPFESEIRGQILSSLEQAVAAGFSEDSRADNKVSRTADLYVLIGAPTGMKEEQLMQFPYEIEGRNYAAAVFSVRKTAYDVFKEINHAYLTHLKHSYPGMAWRLTSESRSSGKNSWFSPVIRPGTKTTPEFQAAVKEIGL